MALSVEIAIVLRQRLIILTLNAKINLNLCTEKMLIPHTEQTLYVLQRLIATYGENHVQIHTVWAKRKVYAPNFQSFEVRIQSE